LPKCPEIYFATLAAIKVGAIAMPLFEAFQPDGLELRLERGDVNLLITNKELYKRYKKIKKPSSLRGAIIIDSWKFKRRLNKQRPADTLEVKEKDTALMIFTSSTAGTPVAGIEIPHSGLEQWIFTGERVLSLEQGSKYFCSAHPAWVTGAVYGILSPLLVGASIYSIEGRFDSKIWIKFLKENKISNIYTAPTALRLLRQDIKKSDFKFVKRICSVGEALPWSLVEEYKKKGVFIIDTYWQTETGAIVIANIDKKAKALGKTIGVNAKIKDEMIVIEKPWKAMMTGIYKHEKMYKGYFDGKWFKTNDRAVKKGNYFYFIGRKDDIIKTSGERVSPLEIENILLKHKAVKEAAVIGVPDKERGEIIKAFIVLNKGDGSDNLKDELGQFVKKNYAGHAYPKLVEFVKELPKGNSGKIIRMKLREGGKQG
jgi:acetyl-CoA synthetase